VKPIIVSLVFALLVIGCSDDSNPGPDGTALDQHVTLDQPGMDQAQACTNGDKRCRGLEWIQECQSGTWVDTVKCSDKKFGPDTCNCSITLMYVCALGANVCQ